MFNILNASRESATRLNYCHPNFLSFVHLISNELISEDIKVSPVNKNDNKKSMKQETKYSKTLSTG